MKVLSRPVLHMNTSILGVRHPLTVFQTGVHVLPKCIFVIQHHPLKVMQFRYGTRQCVPACTTTYTRACTHTHMLDIPWIQNSK